MREGKTISWLITANEFISSWTTINQHSTLICDKQENKKLIVHENQWSIVMVIFEIQMDSHDNHGNFFLPNEQIWMRHET